MATWRWRAGWVGRTLALAFCMYLVLGLLATVVIGEQGGSPGLYAVLAAVSATVALSSAVFVRVRWPDVSIRTLNRWPSDWMIVQPGRWIIRAAIVGGLLFGLFTRDAVSGGGAAVVAAWLAWLVRRGELRRRSGPNTGPTTQTS